MCFTSLPELRSSSFVSGDDQQGTADPRETGSNAMRTYTVAVIFGGKLTKQDRRIGRLADQLIAALDRRAKHSAARYNASLKGPWIFWDDTIFVHPV